MSCGCQKRTLPNGKPACSKCIISPKPANEETRYQNLKTSAPTVESASLNNKK
jgi:hypothetical protein